MTDPRRSRLKTYAGVAVSALLAALAGYVLWRTFQRISFADVVAQMRAVPASTLALAALSASMPSVAAFPEKPIRIVVGFAPGGSLDSLARSLAEGLQKRLGQTVIVENQTGAGGMLSAQNVARAEPDGYTWLIGAAGVVTNGMIRTDMPYADSDLVPVGMIAVAPSVIAVHPSVPVSNLKELVAWSKTQPGGTNIAPG